MKNPMLDLEFLRKLDLTTNKAVYAKIILLTWNEEPVEEIQGKITTGSISIDGNSAVRRTCSLSMVSKQVDINNTYWGFKNKFKLEVGVENTIDVRYPDIIWFKQGIFVFTSLNMNVQSNNFTININGKDKMCLLNGEVGGSINASTDFGKLEEYQTEANGEIVRNIIDIPIIEIIKNAVHVYGGEPLHNIVLNDIDNYGLELLEYRGNNNLYMPRKIDTDEVSNLIINKKQKYYLEDGAEVYVDNEENAKAGYRQIIYYDRTELNNDMATKVWTTKGVHNSNDTNAYNIIKIEYGETAGYRKTELTYPGELVANVGESLVSILDKIKNMFSDFEYFYDIDGKFIFQKKKTYINTSFNNLTVSDNEVYATDAAYTSSYTYSFENGILLTAFTNNPQILNVKNDFSIWGKKKGVGGAELPIHMRYAIDFKPIYYKPLRFVYKPVQLDKDSYQPGKYYIYQPVIEQYILSNEIQFDEAQTYYFETDEQVLNISPFTSEEYDWREIIYQMALDYFKYSYKKDNFAQLVAAANPQHYPTGITGYETYYTDMQGFWRQLYHPGAMSISGKDKYYNLFTHNELYEAAREVILEERKFIEEKDISLLMIDYIYEKFNIIRNNFIESIDYEVGTIDPARDISLLIEQCVKYGFTESTKVIRGLLADRWEKMGGIDNYDYEAWMEEEYNKNGNSSWYKTCQILYNYKNEKDFLNKYSDVDLSLMIRDRIEEGYRENSTVIQGLLSTRWKKIMLTQGKDTYDYLAWMEEEYINNGNSSWYKTCQILYNYKKIQEQEYVDDKEIIMEEIEDGKINIVDPYLSFLYLSRQKKINNYGHDSQVISNEKFLWIVATIIKTFEKDRDSFKENFFSMRNQQLDKNAYDFSSELIEYIVKQYDHRNSFFYINNNTNKISIENAHIQYLLDMRQEKIDELGEALFCVDNSNLVITMIEMFETISDSTEFETKIWEKMNSIYKPLNKDDYDFSLEIIDYISKNYNDKETFFSIDSTNNSIKVQDQFLQYLFAMRQEQIDVKYGEDFYMQNDLLVSIIFEEINSNINAEDFVNEVNRIMEKVNGQFNDDNYDFSNEIIDYIYNNYELKDVFFITPQNKIEILDSYLQHLFNKRQEKIDKIGENLYYIRNSIFAGIIIYQINNHNDKNNFKNAIDDMLGKFNNRNYDFSNEIINYIGNNYTQSSQFFAKNNVNQIEVVNEYLKLLFEMRQEKINRIGYGFAYIENDTLINMIFTTIQETSDVQTFRQNLQTKMQEAPKSTMIRPMQLS